LVSSTLVYDKEIKTEIEEKDVVIILEYNYILNKVYIEKSKYFINKVGGIEI